MIEFFQAVSRGLTQIMQLEVIAGLIGFVILALLFGGITSARRDRRQADAIRQRRPDLSDFDAMRAERERTVAAWERRQAEYDRKWQADTERMQRLSAELRSPGETLSPDLRRALGGQAETFEEILTAIRNRGTSGEQGDTGLSEPGSVSTDPATSEDQATTHGKTQHTEDRAQSVPEPTGSE